METVVFKFKNFKFFAVILFLFLLGCSATHTAFNKRNLDVQTKMSATIFLDPVASDKKTVFLQVKNTTGQSSFDLQDKIKYSIIAKGYKIVEDPKLAHYVLQANVLQVGKSDLRAADYALNGGFGGAVSGALIGGGVGALASNDGKGMLAGALIGGAVSTIADALVKDIVYTAITDVQISEKVFGSSVEEKTKSKLKQGTSGSSKLKSIKTVNWKKYQTRIVSTANKANLKFEEAAKPLREGLARTIAGIF